jgi:phosphoglycolate phosphatase
MADEFAQFLTSGVGSGGGHKQKAGGFISKAKMEERGTDIEAFLADRARVYFRDCEVISAANHDLDVSAMKRYKKLPVPVAFAMSTDIFDEGTPMIIRTLEGDAEAETSSGIYLMIGILGEVYPIKAEKFGRSYRVEGTVGDSFRCGFSSDFTYSPTVRNKYTGETVELLRYACPCVAVGDVTILAAPLTKRVKVFTAWNPESYMAGQPGDFIAVRADDTNDVYIVRGDIFERTYAAV